MNNALIVTSSAQAGQSVSNALAGSLEQALRARHPGIEIVRRDVGAEPVPDLASWWETLARAGVTVR